MAAATRRPLELSCEIARSVQGEKKSAQSGVLCRRDPSLCTLGVSFRVCLRSAFLPLRPIPYGWLLPSPHPKLKLPFAVFRVRHPPQAAKFAHPTMLWRKGENYRAAGGCPLEFPPTNFRGEFWYSSLRGHSTSETNHS